MGPTSEGLPRNNFLPNRTMAQQDFVSAQKIQDLIAQGDPIVIHEGYVLNISTWIDNHPGGRLAILHMVGRDASDEINMYALQVESMSARRPTVTRETDQFAIATTPTRPF